MEKRVIQINYDVLVPEELAPGERIVVEAARKATEGSYSPYSHFSVGAAVLLADGTVVAGSNQENAAFPSGICAERCAMFYANASHPDQPVLKIAIAARRSDGQFTEQPVTPCGACRQVLLETECRYGQPVEVLLCGTEAVYRLPSVRSLLPFHFDDSSM